MKNLANLSCTQLKGVGPKLAAKLAKCSIHTIQDILFHLPLKYQDRTHVTPIVNVRHGDYAVIEGMIEAINVQVTKRAILSVKLRDHHGAINLCFFHFTAAQKDNFEIGTCVRAFGQVRGSYRGLEMIHPEYRRILSEKVMPVEETLTPIYPTTQGLQQQSWRKITDAALELLAEDYQLEEYLPGAILKDMAFPAINDALLFIHRPPPDANIVQLAAGLHPAQQRLAFEELLAHHLSVRKLRSQAQANQAMVLTQKNGIRQEFLNHLNFKLTKAQERVIEEIKQDLQNPYPMLRLVQGDVGCGKTIVAIMSMLLAVENGYQAAMMAPTDLLAEQHATNFAAWLKPLNIPMAWLCGKHKGKLREKLLHEIKNGDAKIIVGTHALFQQQVQFDNLAFVVIDEQHRFGVHQRLALREKGKQENHFPHQLIMTATPIPRTLSMTAYADLDVSIIDELPPGRTPVKTVVIVNEKRDLVMQRIRQACQARRQAYWVCPLIEESETLQCQAAEATTTLLQSELTDLNIGLIHGRIKAKEKTDLMQRFKNGEIDLLVATTVIEVGVDVPNASLMIIENAERLGLAQLHQLRGRIGRGNTESFCVLLYQNPLSHIAKERLQIMRKTTDGFIIAQKDLEIRGPGEVLGTKQTGIMQFKVADFKRDQKLLPKVVNVATKLMQQCPEQVDKITKRWLQDQEKYGAV